MRAVEVAQQPGRPDPRVDDVDAQRAAAGPYGGGGPFGGLEQFAGGRQERLPVDGEPGAARRPGEQPHAEILLERGDALGDGLLGDRQVIGGGSEPARSTTATKVRTASSSMPTDPSPGAGWARGTTRRSGSPAGRLFAAPGTA
jgi:hypothetical protein